MNEWIQKRKIKAITSRLNKLGRMPRFIEFAEKDGIHIVNTFDVPGREIISEKISTGVSSSPSVATLKSLTEHVERKAFSEFYSQSNSNSHINRSDGVAAYPILNSLKWKSKKMARDNAYFEALERYVWAKWWDDRSIQYKRCNIEDYPKKILKDNQALIDLIRKQGNFEKIEIIEPQYITDSQSSCVLICIGFLKDGGVISGGAAGLKRNKSGILFRGLAEMLRHAIAVKRANAHRGLGITFYERRLLFFSEPSGRQLLEDRLSVTGSTPICIPNLSIDFELKHSLSEIIYVHRCLFENQPLFVGGSLERLCL